MSNDETLEKKRALKQLMEVAQEYLRLAEEMGAGRSTEPTGKFHDLIKAGKWKDARSFVITSAHLTSAAIRLATVQETLGPLRRSECDRLAEELATADWTEPDQRLADCMHIMLRDGVAHRETISDGPENEHAWHARRILLRRLSISAMARMLGRICVSLEGQIRGKNLAWDS